MHAFFQAHHILDINLITGFLSHIVKYFDVASINSSWTWGSSIWVGSRAKEDDDGVILIGFGLVYYICNIVIFSCFETKYSS